MRGTVVCLLLLGCVVRPEPDPDPIDPGWTNPPNIPDDGRCRKDSDCNGSVCTRNGQCLPASQVWSVHVTWTLTGMPASVATCTNSPDLQIQFSTGPSVDPLSYAPVPCENGKFTVDKISKSFTMTTLFPTHATAGTWTPFDAMGNAAIDLFPEPD